MMNKISINESLQEDALAVCSSIYRMNAKNSKGYLFNSNDGKKVSSGMFCDFIYEIDSNKWSYYIDFSNYNVVYEII